MAGGMVARNELQMSRHDPQVFRRYNGHYKGAKT
jgi:hypothetical protein